MIYRARALSAAGSFIAALAQHASAGAVLGLGVVLSAAWLAVSGTMSPPSAPSTNYSMGET